MTALASLGAGLLLAWLGLPLALRLAGRRASCGALRTALVCVALLPPLVASRSLLPDSVRPRLPVRVQINAWLDEPAGARLPFPRPLREPLRIATAFEVMGVLWLLLLAAGTAAEARRVVQRRRLLAGGGPAPRAVAARVSSLARELGLRAPRVLVSNELVYAGVFGVVRPCLLLPAADLRLNAEELELVLQHELSHLHRGDPLWGALESLAGATLAGHPALPALRRALELAREVAVDRLVAKGRALEYARLLLHIAERSAAAHPLTVPVGTALHRRIEMLIENTSTTTRYGWFSGLGIGALVSALGLVAPAAFAEPFQGPLPPPHELEPKVAIDTEACYELARKPEPKLVIDSHARLELNGEGQVQVAHIPASSSIFQNCIEERALAWQFPVPPRGGHKPPADAKLFVAFPIRRSPD